MKRTYFFMAACVALSSSVLAQGDPATVAKLIDIGKNKSQVMRHLTELTTKVGSRLTASPRLEKAEQWAMTKFRSFGLTNVHQEKWGEWPVGWQREESSGRMVEPFDVPIVFTSPSWSEGTNGPLRGEAIIEPSTMEEYEAVKGRLKGAWLINPKGFPRTRRASATTETAPAELTPAEKLKKLIDESGIAGRVYGSRGEQVLTSGNFNGKTADKHPLDRNVIIRKSDMDRIQRNIEYKRKVELEFNLNHKWIKGPVSNYNVVADLKGTEKPDEMIIVCGHLDSWDGPGSQGACDNGTGSCTAIEAARILTAAGVKPKRTIRFILWTGEEQGLFGSRGYVEAHKDEMDKISAVLNDDGGSGYQAGYVGPEVMKPYLETAFAPTVAAFPDMPQKFRVVSSIRRQETGSDHASFWKYGVPAFFTEEGGGLDYNYLHHTQHDRLDQANEKFLIQSATNHAVVAFNLAQAADLIPRDPTYLEKKKEDAAAAAKKP